MAHNVQGGDQSLGLDVVNSALVKTLLMKGIRDCLIVSSEDICGTSTSKTMFLLRRLMKVHKLPHRKGIVYEVKKMYLTVLVLVLLWYWGTEFKAFTELHHYFSVFILR